MSALTSSMEDYLEAIWVIQTEKTVPRVKDVAKYLAGIIPEIYDHTQMVEKRISRRF